MEECYEAGNIAEAALEIHNVMQAAQDAATHYIIWKR